jgi:hypothetical protein
MKSEILNRDTDTEYECGKILCLLRPANSSLYHVNHARPQKGGTNNALTQSVLILLFAPCVVLVCQKVRLDFLNARSLRRLAAFNITESSSTLCLSLTVIYYCNYWSTWWIKYNLYEAQMTHFQMVEVLLAGH